MNSIPNKADYIVDFTPQKHIEDGTVPEYPFTELNTDTLIEGETIFVITDRMNEFIVNILPKIKIKFHLLVGITDVEFDENYRLLVDDSRVLSCTGTNISIQNHPKITKILIGFPAASRKRGTKGLISGDRELISISYDSKKPLTDKINKLLITWASPSHNDRKYVEIIFKNATFTDFASKKGYMDYMQNINDYKFVLSPRGNGIDTYRYSEILLMGSIPIVETSGLNDLYSKFPCIIVEQFSDVTEKLLNDYVFDDKKYTEFLSHITLHQLPSQSTHSALG